MKNIHILPSPNPSRLLYFGTSKELTLQVNLATFRTFERSPQNIYITNSEEIKEGDWYLEQKSKFNPRKLISDKWGDGQHFKTFNQEGYKKIILTDNQDLIKDSVQPIDDEFLEWFVKNTNCQEVEVYKDKRLELEQDFHFYEIIIPKEEPKQVELLGGIEKGKRYVIVGKHKQETLEEIIERESEIRYPVLTHNNPSDSPYVGIQKTFKHGVKFGIELQQERSYSEEEVLPLIEYFQWIIKRIDKEDTPEEIVRLLLLEKDKIKQFKKK